MKNKTYENITDLVKYILIAIFLFFLSSIPFFFAWWGYNFLTGVFLLPKVSLFKFFLIVIALKLILNLFKNNDSKK